MTSRIVLGAADSRVIGIGYSEAGGDTLEFGQVRLEVLETPGHTAESISILIFDLECDATRAGAVLTGDTLFVGDVGRPDLRASLGWSATDLGRLLYDVNVPLNQLETRVESLPREETTVVHHEGG